MEAVARRDASEVLGMVGSWLRWSVAAVALLTSAAAQGTLSGTYAADDVAGAIVIACWPSEQDGCDEARSGSAEVVGSGPTGTWRIDDLGAGPFLLLAWRDLDGDGEATEDELDVLLEADGSPRLVTAPAQGLALGSAVGTPPAAGGKAALPGTAPPAALPADLVGVWQTTRAAAGDYRDLTTGSAFTMTSGYSTNLKLRPDGAFEYLFFSSGVANDCAYVSHLERAVGVATWTPGRLVLTPTAHDLEVNHCARSGQVDLGVAPMVFAASLTDGFDMNRLRTWTLTLEGGPVPRAYTLLDRPPLLDPPAPSRPADFVLGVDPPYAELQGTWTPGPGSRTDFYDPVTGRLDIPEPDGADHGWVRFVPGGYEMAQSWYAYNGYQGVCKKDLVYYERGRAELAVTENLSGSSVHVLGHARFVASDARLFVRLRECGVDDGVVAHAAPLQTSYYTFIYQGASNDLVALPEVLTLGCPWAWTEFQPLFCGGSYGLRSLGRRD